MISELRRAGPLASLVPLLLLVSFVGCESRVADSAEDAPRSGGIAVACTQVLPAGLNAFTSPDQIAADLRLLIFTPLVLYDRAGAFRPYLASSWSWDDERRRLVFEVRDDLTWHDGEPVTVEDVLWTIRAAADPEYGYWSGHELDALEDVRQIGPNTIELLFDRPFVADLEPFVALPILPRHLLADLAVQDFATAEYHRAPIGSGPFRFAGRTPEGLIRFDRYEAFPEDLGRARLDRIALRAVPEPATLVIELATGSLDLCIAGSSVATEVQSSPNVRSLPVEPAGIQVIPLDTRRDPLSDVRVRRAISAALRRSEMAAVVSPVAAPARTFLPAASKELDSAFGQPDGDPELAVSLLESAGWTTVDAQGIRRNAAGDRLRFTLVAPVAYETVLTVAQAQLRRVGIDLELRFMEGAAYVATIRDPETRPVAMALAFTPERQLTPNPRPELHSTGYSNLASYSDSQVDALIERLEHELDPEERRELYREIQQKVAEDVPTVYTLYLPRVVLFGPRLQDVEVDLNGPFATAAQWWIRDGQRRAGP